MKKIVHIALVLVGLMPFSYNAQFIDYERDNGWKLGVNIGGTWQDAEQMPNTSFKINPYAGLSGGLTFGKSIFERPGSFLAFDLRYRFLAGKSYGWLGVPLTDSDITDNGTIPYGFYNYRFGYRENTLEGVLTLHSLRERTGLLLYGFGGLGFTRYNVTNDFRGGSNMLNDYSAIDTNQSASVIAAALRNASDMDFETTNVASKIKFMPSLGAGIGYQVTPSFSLGLEYKVTYALNDEIDGFAGGKNDRYHYAAFILRWGLLRSRTNYRPNSTFNNNNVNDYSTNQNTVNTPVNTPPNNPMPTGNRPLVNIYNPSVNNSVVHNQNFLIKAKIYYVVNSSNVIFRHNGNQIYGFTFNPNTNEFAANVNLMPGSNVFEIIGSNNYGSDQDSKVIIFQPQDFSVAGPPPVVKITNPPYTPFNVVSSNTSFPVTAQILNVTNANNVRFKVNGTFVNGFNFNPNTNSFSYNLNLVQGNNIIEVLATNNFGQASDVATIIYTRQENTPPPVVTIQTPSTTPFNTSNPVEIINGTVLNVASANNINVNINGTSISNFNYDYNTKKISFSANLIVGANVVTITGSNNVGVDSKSTTLIFKPSEVVALPVVDFTFPLTSPYSSPNQNITLKATVLNVASKNDITVTGNGMVITNFSYNAVSKEVVFNTNLISGSNLFKVVGVNAAGSDFDEVVVTSKGGQLLPPQVQVLTPATNPYNSNSQQYTITAKIINIDGSSNVGFLYNGLANSNFVYNANTKDFSATVILNEGANSFQISGTNGLGTDSKSGTINYQIPQEIQPPVVVINNPATNPYETFNNAETVNASVYNVASAAAISVLINGVATSAFTFDNVSKKLSLSANLILGTNVVQISGTNQAGVATKSTTIIRKNAPVVPLPIVQFTVPSTSPTTVTTATLALKGTVLNVAGKNNITIAANGASVTNFTYNTTTKEVAFSSNLINGSNLFIITGENEAGIAQAQTIVIYNYVEPIQPPVVNITKPSSNPFSTISENEQIIADVLNVSAVSGVSATFNGTAINNFSFDPATHKFSYNANLLPGTNTLTIVGSNTAGIASKTQTIMYNPVPPCVAPIITLNQPSAEAKSSQIGAVSINTDNNKGAILGTVLNAKNIVFKINGVVSSGYNYNPKTGSFESMLNLVSGANTYQLIATNECGSATINITYIYTPQIICNEPVITFITPPTSPLNYSGPATNTFSANVLNLSNSNQVSVRLNGNIIPVTFDLNTGIVTGSATLVNGVNKILITAKNECGTTDKETIINFTQPINPPVVTFTKPNRSPLISTNSEVAVLATVTNVVQTGVLVSVDGQVINTWQYNAANNTLSIALNLPVGTHNLSVKGTNASGTDTKSLEIVINGSAPVVEFLNIINTTQLNPHSVSGTQFTVLGRVLNFDGAVVTYEKNGGASNDFTYNSNTGEFSIPLQQALPAPNTTNTNQLFAVRIRATKNAAQDTKTGYVKFPDLNTVSNNLNNNNLNTNTNTNDPNAGCMPTIQVTFNYLHSAVQVKSNKDLSNVVLKFSDNTTQKFDNLTGLTGAFQGTGAHLNKCLIGVYVKSGCNSSNDGPGFGEWKPNTAYNGSCEMSNSAPAPNTNTMQNNNQKLQDDEYNHNIQKGDLYFNAKNFSTAKTFYMKASAIKPNEAYPKSKIQQCDNFLNTINTPTVKPTPTTPVVRPTNKAVVKPTDKPVAPAPAPDSGKSQQQRTVTPSVAPTTSPSPTPKPRGGS